MNNSQLRRGLHGGCAAVCPHPFSLSSSSSSSYVSSSTAGGKEAAPLHPSDQPGFSFFLLDFSTSTSSAVKNKAQQLGLKSAALIRPLPSQSALLRSKSRLRASPGPNGNVITLEEPAEPTPARVAWGGGMHLRKNARLFLFIY